MLEIHRVLPLFFMLNSGSLLDKTEHLAFCKVKYNKYASFMEEHTIESKTGLSMTGQTDRTEGRILFYLQLRSQNTCSLIMRNNRDLFILTISTAEHKIHKNGFRRTQHDRRVEVRRVDRLTRLAGTASWLPPYDSAAAAHTHRTLSPPPLSHLVPDLRNRSLYLPQEKRKQYNTVDLQKSLPL